MPVGYSSGISQPPNGTIRAPSARWTASSGEPLEASYRPAVEPARGASACVVAERHELGVDVVLDAGQRQHVEHALAPAQHVDELVAVAQHDLVAADDDVGRGDVGA